MSAADLRVFSTIAFALEHHGGTTPFLRQAEDVVKQLAAEGLAIVPAAGAEGLAARLRAALAEERTAADLAGYYAGEPDVIERYAKARAATDALVPEVER